MNTNVPIAIFLFLMINESKFSPIQNFVYLRINTQNYSSNYKASNRIFIKYLSINLYSKHEKAINKYIKIYRQKPLFNISNRTNNLLDNNLKITKLIKRLKIEPKNTLLSTLYIIRFHYKYKKIYPHKLQQK